MDDHQQLLLAFGAAIAAVLVGIVIVLAFDLDPGYATLGLLPTLLIVGRLISRGSRRD